MLFRMITRYNFILMRIGAYLFLTGILTTFILQSVYFTIYVGMPGFLFCWMFSFCPNCRTNILSYYAHPLRDWDLFAQLLCLKKMSCPYCNKDDN